MQMKNLLVRAATALAFVGAIVVIHQLWGRDGLLILGLFLLALGSFEFSAMFFRDAPAGARAHLHGSFVMTSLTGLALLMSPRLSHSPAIMVVLVIGLMFAFWGVHTKLDIDQLYRYLSRFVFGYFFVPVLGSTGLQLLQSAAGEIWFYFLISTIAATDTSAYVVGLTLGKKKLSPQVSPKKSWAGFFGGLAGSGLVGLVFAQLFPQVFGPGLALTTALTGGLAGQTGDLLESLMKRRAQVKDSGALLPGHGGVLDRVDGILFAAPIFALAYTFF